MAADGSLIFDTSLDTSGFEAGSEKLLKAVERLKAHVNDFGADMGKAFSMALLPVKAIASVGKSRADAMTSALEKQQAKIDSVLAEMEKLSGQKIKTEEYAELEKATDKAGKKVESLYDRQEKFEATGVKENSAAWRNLQFELQKATEEFDRMDKAKKMLEESGGATVSGEETARYKELQNQVNDLRAKYDELSAAKRRMEEAEKEAPKLENARALSSDIAKAVSEIDKYQTAVDKMNALGATDKQWASVQYDIEQVIKKLDEYQAKLKENPAGNFTADAYINLSDALSAAAANADKLKNSLPADLLSPVSEESREAEQSLKGLDDELKEKPKDAGLANTALSGLGDAIKSVGQKALSMTVTLAKMPLRAFGAGITGFTNKLKASVSPTDKLVKSLTSFKRLLITRIKRTFISAIFNQAKESLKSLALFSSRFNTAMSNIKNASTQTAGNLAIALGGAIKTLEPMITGFINAINAAIVAVNKFFAMLGGKSTMTVAKKQTDNWAASINKAGNTAKKASKQLYSFDEIERQQAEDAGGGADAAADIFEEMETVAVENPLDGFFDVFRAAWENEGLATINAIKKAWESIKALVKSVGGELQKGF